MFRVDLVGPANRNLRPIKSDLDISIQAFGERFHVLDRLVLQLTIAQSFSLLSSSCDLQVFLNYLDWKIWSEAVLYCNRTT